jgi:hypothetical protein
MDERQQVLCWLAESARRAALCCSFSAVAIATAIMSPCFPHKALADRVHTRVHICS